MASAIDPLLPLQIGDVVILCDLKSSTDLNDQEAIVERFLPEKKRFKVRLHPSGRHVSVCARNARFNPFTKKIPRSIFEFQRVCASAKSVNEIRQTINEIKSFREAFPSLYAYVLETASVSLNALTTDSQILNEMILILKQALDLSLSERASVGIKLELAKIYNHLNQTPKARKVLSKVKKRHFGRLPEIIAVLTLNNATRRDILLQSYKELKPILESRHYSYHFKKTSTAFYASVAQAACHTHPDLDILRSLPKLLYPSEDPIHKARAHMLYGHLYFAEKSFEDALEEFTQAREIDAALFGEMGMRNAVFYQALCLVQIGDKVKAKKLLKKLKRMKYGKYNLKPLEKMIQKMKGGVKASASVNVKAKCSNPLCIKVEKKKLEFLKCGKCRAMTYCSSKCLREHWKSGHGNECKPVKV